MQRLFNKKGIQFVLALFVIVCIFCLPSLVFAEGFEQDEVCVEDYSVLNTEDNSVERLSSLFSQSNATDAEKHFLRMEEQLAEYKDFCDEDPSIPNEENKGVEKLVSVNSQLCTHISTEEHYSRIKEQLSEYKKGMENYAS